MKKEVPTRPEEEKVKSPKKTVSAGSDGGGEGGTAGSWGGGATVGSEAKGPRTAPTDKAMVDPRDLSPAHSNPEKRSNR